MSGRGLRYVEVIQKRPLWSRRWETRYDQTVIQSNDRTETGNEE
jgi:hypothetical protein